MSTTETGQPTVQMKNRHVTITLNMWEDAAWFAKSEDDFRRDICRLAGPHTSVGARDDGTYEQAVTL